MATHFLDPEDGNDPLDGWSFVGAQAVVIEEIRPYRKSSLKPASVTTFPAACATIDARAALQAQAVELQGRHAVLT